MGRRIKRTEVEFCIENAEGHKGELSMASLAELMRLWSDVLEAIVRKGKPPAPAEHGAQLRRVIPGSARCYAGLPGAHLRAVSTVERAVQRGTMAPIPRQARSSFRKLTGQLVKSGQQLQIVKSEKARLNGATLQADLADDPEVLVEGETTLLGRVRSVGGMDPNMHLETPGRKAVVIETTQQQAQEIAQQLYRLVVVDVKAQWTAETAEIDSCSLISWRPGPTLELAEGIDDYAKRYGADWLGEDGVDWLRKLRSEGDE